MNILSSVVTILGSFFLTVNASSPTKALAKFAILAIVAQVEIWVSAYLTGYPPFWKKFTFQYNKLLEESPS